MRSTNARIPVATGLLLGLAILTFIGARFAPNDARAAEVGLSAIPTACNVTCVMEVCGEDWDEHKALEDGHLDSDHPDFAHDACNEGGCDWLAGNGYHPQCTGFAHLTTSGDYARLKAALSEMDTRSLKRILRRNPKTLVINAERQSIQVLGCDSLPLANYPLGPTLLRRLASTK